MPALDKDWHIISRYEENVKPFNNYFTECSILNDTFENLPNNYHMLTQTNLEYLKSRVGDVHKYLSQINTNKTSG